MAYVNVAEWTPEQVCEWIRGLDHCLAVYAEDFLENKINGLKLLQLAPDLLANLGVKKIGHQVVLLQAIKQLQNIHYNLDQETLQNLALRLNSKARSIYNELKPLSPPTPVNCGGSGCEGDGNSTDEDDRAITKMTKRRARLVSTEVIASVADCLSSVKMMVLWLNISPFEGIETYDKLKSDLVELGIKLATISLRDLFAEDQTTVIRDNCYTLSDITDKIIQNCKDPLIIQPASLDVVTIKKLPKEFIGLQCASTYDGVHPVCLISPLTPAHNSGKIHEGDHLVQVNYQTVIGWQPDKVGDMLVENNTEVILTIKKQPRHASGSTQIYFKPFRLPSKKRSYNHGYNTASDFTYRNDFMNLGLHSLLENNHLHVSKLSTVKRDVTKSPVVLSATSESSSTADSSPRKEILLSSPSSKEDLPAVTFAKASSVAGSPDSSVSSVFVTVPTNSVSPVTKQNVTHLDASDTIELDIASVEEEEEDAFLSSASDSDTCIDNEDAASTSASVRLYPPKPRSIVHRRATIPGDSVPPGIAPNTLNRYIEGLRMNGMALRSASHSRNSQYSVDRDYTYLRSPGDNCNRLRPHTTIGKPTRVPLGPSSLPPAMAPSFADLPPKSPSNTSNLMYPLPLTITSPPTPLTPKPPSTPHTPNSGLIGGRRVSEDRPKLDKSHSTPAYDFGANGGNGGGEGEVFTYTDHLTPRPDCVSSRQSDSQSGDTLLPPGKKPCPANADDSSVPPDLSKLPENTAPSHRNIPLAKLKDQATFYCNEQSFGDSVFYCPSENLVPKVTEKNTCGNLLVVPSPERSKSPLLERRTPGAVRPSNLDIRSASIEERVFFPVIIEKPAQLVIEDKTTPVKSEKITDLEKATTPVAAEKPIAEEMKDLPTLTELKPKTLSEEVAPAEIISASSPALHPEEDFLRKKEEKIDTSQRISEPYFVNATNPAADSRKRDFFKSLRGGMARTYEHFSSKDRSKATPTNQCSSTTSMFDIVSSFTSRFYSSSSMTCSEEVVEDSSNELTKLKSGVCGGGRGVACRELGVGDHQGWLYRRSRTPSTFLHSHTWQKKWFILKRGYLYGYSHSTANKAESLIYLPGFHVCPAQDVKTKKFAFKIYHANGATFYFACDSGEERSRWMSEMGLSAISSSKCSDSGGSPSPPPLSKHDEEAYFSETDDETECSSEAHHTNLVAPVVTNKSDNSSSKESHGGLSSLFHWTMGGSGGGSTKPSTGGAMKLFQTKHVEAVPTSNFRSYKRVRDNGRSTSTSDLCSPPIATTETTPSSNIVSRKGSLREKLRNHLPAALSLDRKKRNVHKNAEIKKQSLEKEESVKEVINEEKKEEEDKENKKEDKRLSTGSSDSQPITPLKCKLINNSSSGDSPAGYKSDASHKSWMCNLKSSQTLGYHINRVNSSQSSSSPNTPKTPKGNESSFNLNKSLSGTFSDPRANSVERLKRTGNYRPVTLKSREPMKAAFSMGLDESKSFNKSKSSSFLDNSTPTSSLRPQVPPRTKFLSPSERLPPDHHTPLRNGSEEPKTPLKFTSSPLTSTSIASVRPTMGVAMIGKQRRTPGVLSPREVFFCSPPPSPSPITPHQHAYFPNTTLASTSTPYLSTNNSSSTPLNSKSSASQSSLEGATISNYNGKPIQVLPHYPNMEYPPIFEGGSYTISGSSMSSSMSALRGGSSLSSTSIGSITNSELESSEAMHSCLNATENERLIRSTSPTSHFSTRGENDFSNKPWKTPRPPMPNPRSFTPNNSSMNQYCNLDEFSSANGGTPGGVVVGISCSPLPVVGHHHSIYVTSPAVPPPEVPRRRSNEVFSRSSDNIRSSVEHRTPPSTSSLSRKCSGGSLLTPQRSDSLSSTYQHGGSSGGTVIATTVKAAGEPPKLILPPPPTEPPP